MSYSPYAPPQASHYRVPRFYEALGWKTTVTAILIAASSALTVLLLMGIGVVGKPSAENALPYAVVLGIGLIVQQFVTLATCIFFLVWMHQASKNAHAFRPEDLRFTPGWCVGWWFIPVLGMWKPYQALKEIWLASEPATPTADDAWRSASLPMTFPLWWATYLLSGFLMIAATAVSTVALVQHTEDVIGKVVMDASLFLTVAATVAIIVIIRQLDRRQAAAQNARTASE